MDPDTVCSRSSRWMMLMNIGRRKHLTTEGEPAIRLLSPVALKVMNKVKETKAMGEYI